MARLKLNKENYYTPEANYAYWSASFVKAMYRCEAAAMAELRGEYRRPDTSAILIGGYVDAAFAGKGVLDKFTQNHPEVFNIRTGELKSEFKLAQRMIQRAKGDRVFMDYLRGQKQKILTGNIGGLPFKGKPDFFLKGQRLVDLKTVRDMQPIYMPARGLVSFAEYWDWPLQCAIYRELEGHGLSCYLAVITKEDPPDIEVIEIPHETMDAEIALLVERLPRLEEVRLGNIEPERCGKCAYCRATKSLAGAVPLSEFEEV